MTGMGMILILVGVLNVNSDITMEVPFWLMMIIFGMLVWRMEV